MKNHLRLFGRHAETPSATVVEAPTVGGAAAGMPACEAPTVGGAAAGMPVVDRAGRAFETARECELGVGLWRVETVDDLPGLAADTVVLYAAHDQDELERGWALMRRQPTVVMGMGLGAHAGSRALILGAIGYIHDGLDRTQLSGAFEDAITRQRYRSIRATGRLAVSA